MKDTLRPFNSSISRPGIALMVTVGIIALIAVVILGNVKLVDDSMHQTKQAQAFNQDQAMLKSFYTLLKEQASEITSAETLDGFLLTVAGLGDDKGYLNFGVNISSLQGKVNINAIFDEDNKTLAPHYETMFLRMFEAYEIKESSQLLALIADTIDTDNSERHSSSELMNRYADMPQGRIVDAKHLKRLSTFYDEVVEDNNVYKIPWNDFFRFGKVYEAGGLDCNYLRYDLARFMGVKTSSEALDSQYLSCAEIGEDQNVTKADFHMEAFNKSKPYYLQVQTEYQVLSHEGKLSFILEIKDKEISHIKSY